MKCYLKSFIAAAAVSVLAACTAVLPQPAAVPVLGEGEVHWFQAERFHPAEENSTNAVLAVYREGEALRFVLTDALGAPLSRQLLDRNGWRNDGFVMPNADARRLFAALLPVLAADGKAVYPSAGQENHQGGAVFAWKQQELWRIETEQGGYRIAFPDGVRWHLHILDEGAE
ncbi:MAG: hypothetical protein Q4D82_00470 [Neisseria sp.]|nr:hypothetical protein [Neisseria sp.]